jgi:FtsZ-binding cell division protein ZapB
MTQQEKMSAINGKAAEINELKRKLASTDYVVTRDIEQGLEIPADFKNERQGWRDDINALEAEIAELEALEPDEDDPSRSMEE